MATGSMTSKEVRRIFRTTALAMLAIVVIVLFFRNLYSEQEATLKQTTGATVSGSLSFAILSPSACAPINLTAVRNADNVSVDLSWTEPTGCEFNNYTIYYSTNVSEMENFDFASAIPDVILPNTTTTWTDWNANSTQQRYYRVAANSSNIITGANQTAGKFDWYFIANSPKSIALPLEPVDTTLNYLIHPAEDLDIDHPDTIRAFFGNKSQTIAGWYGPSIGWYDELGNWSSLQLEPNVGYYVYPINNSYNTTIVGLVPAKTNVTFSFLAGSPASIGINQPYFYNLSESLHPAEDLDIDHPDTIRAFFGNKSQTIAGWYGPSIGWYDELGNWSNLMLEPGTGYYLYPINNSYSDTINTSSGVIV